MYIKIRTSFQVGHPSDPLNPRNSLSGVASSRRYPRRHHRHHKNKTVTTADVLTTSASVEALLLSPTSENSISHRTMEAASSPMSPLTANLTSVEINDNSHAANANSSSSTLHVTTTPNPSLAASSELDLNMDIDSPSRFSSNSINTVILNPNVVQTHHHSSGRHAIIEDISTNDDNVRA